MSEPTRMTTRAKNADSHPGLLAMAAKRPRAPDGVTKKAAAEAKKKAMEDKREHAVEVIAGIERRIAEKNAVDVTPGDKHQLQRIQAFYGKPPAFPDAVIGIPRNTESERAARNLSENGDLTDREAPPKKKTKSVKLSFRDSVERHLKERDGDELWEVAVPRQGPPPNHARTSELPVQDSGEEEFGDELVTPKPKPRRKIQRVVSSSEDGDGDDEKDEATRQLKVKNKLDAARSARTDQTSGHERNNPKPNSSRGDSPLDLIGDWANQIPPNANSKGKRPRHSSGRTGSTTLVNSHSACIPPSTRSALSNGVTISQVVSHDNDRIEINDGRLSDRDETVGKEYDAAMKSPPKHGKRITGDELIKREDSLPPKSRAATSRKPSNNGLPKECLDDKTWRKKVITSLFRWAGIQPNPWVMPDTKIVDALTKICGAYWGTSIELTITTDSNAFRLASQRLSDSWRSIFGSSAIAILIAFFESHDNYRYSDEKRQDFAQHALDKYRFIYRKAKGENRKKFRGLFEGSLVIQTFAAHFNAIDGSRWIQDLYEGEAPPKPYAALALATVACECSLVLISTGAITIAKVHEAKSLKRAIKLPATINPETGKQSRRQTAFSEMGWGNATRSYLKSAQKLTDAEMENIMASAKAFSRASRREEGAVDDDPEDERAHLDVGSGSSEDESDVSTDSD